jgi:hypothetical protein
VTRTFSGLSADDVWHQLTSTITAPANAASATIQLSFQCFGGNCTSADTVNFDDLVPDQSPPTSVRLASFAADRSGRTVTLRWRTASETSIAGFHVWRGHKKVSAGLIPARGGMSGASYRYVDRFTPGGRTCVYRLEIVSVAGRTTWFGPLRIQGWR